jgi:hypothetical protein
MAQRSSIFKILGVVVGLAFVFFGFQERSSLSRMKSIGQAAIVQPIAGYTQHKSKGSTTYTAEFTFKTESGSVITRKRSFPEELIKDFESKIPVKVLYDPRNPSEFVFEKETASWFLIGIGFAIAVAALIFA